MPLSPTGTIHSPSNSRSKGTLSILGVCLVVLPWLIFSFGARGLYLYLVLGVSFAIIMACLNYRELWDRLRNRNRMPPVSTREQPKETAQKSFELTYQDRQIVSAMVSGCSNWRTMSDEEFAEWFRNLKLRALEATENERTRQARINHARQAARDIQFRASALGRLCLGGPAPTAEELRADAIRFQPRRVKR